MDPIQMIQISISITGLILASISFLREKKERDILLVLVGLVLLALFISILVLVK